MDISKLSKLKQRTIKSFEVGYRVNDDGNVLSPFSGKPMKLREINGYCVFSLGKYKVSVHQLVAYQKYGYLMLEEGIVVRHLNGDCKDNSKDNIAIGTNHDNQMDMTPEQRTNRSKKAALKKRGISQTEAEELRKDRLNGLTYRELMNKYGIKNKSVVSYIVNNKTYTG